jgi:mandelate racemase
VLLKLQRPIVARIATITEWPLILIDLTTCEGIVGRAYLEPYTARTMRYLVQALHDLGDVLKGRRVAPVELYTAARKSLHFVGYQGLSAIAVSGIDMAAWVRWRRLPAFRCACCSAGPSVTSLPTTATACGCGRQTS